MTSSQAIEASTGAGRSSEHGVFEVFSLGDPALELWLVAKYMLIPFVAGTLIIRLVMYGLATVSGEQSRLSPWPVAAMLTIVLSPIYVSGLFVHAVAGQLTFAHTATAVVVALFLTVPSLVVLVPVFAIYVRDGSHGEPTLSDHVVYAAIGFCLLVEYFWIGSIVRSNFH